MAVRKLKPTSAGRRFQTVSDFEEITRTTPEKSLTEGLTKKAGRNNHGRVTSRRRGGGVKRLYRIIDFKRNKLDIPATVAHIEYDPNRTARIALLHYADGEKRYILAPLGVKQGDVIVSGEKADIKPGNALPMARIPVGTVLHNIELNPGRGGQFCRAAGTYAQLVAKEGKYALLRSCPFSSPKTWWDTSLGNSRRRAPSTAMPPTRRPRPRNNGCQSWNRKLLPNSCAFLRARPGWSPAT